MTFDCFKLHSKCKAMCCKAAPIEKEIWDRNQDKIVRPVEDKLEFLGVDPIEQRKNLAMVLPITKDAYCPFLNQDLSCNIYDDRPSVCRKYGSEAHPCLVCPFQDKTGRVRSRQENRGLLRQADKRQEAMFKSARQEAGSDNPHL